MRRNCSSSNLSLAFTRGGEERAMRVVRQDPPWRVVRKFTTAGGESLVHVHNLSGGILSGDRLAMLVELHEGARVILTTTGATRIYRHRETYPTAYTYTRVLVGKDAVLEYLPDQLIPYERSRYFQETEIELFPEAAGLFWWETIAPGRSASGETFRYTSLRIASIITCDDRPIAIDQFHLEPQQRPLQQPGVLGNFECCSTFYICKTGLAEEQWVELEGLLGEEAGLLSDTEMQWGASRLVRHGIVIRGVGRNSRRLFSALLNFWNIAKVYLYGSVATMPRKVY